MTELTGSEKQIKWANDIRANFLTRIEKMKSFVANHKDPEMFNENQIKECVDFLNWFAMEFSTNFNNAGIIISRRDDLFSVFDTDTDGKLKAPNGKMRQKYPQNFLNGMGEFSGAGGVMVSAFNDVEFRGQI